MLVQLSITCAGSSLSIVGSMAVTVQRQVSLATDEVSHPIQWRDRVGITPTSLLSRTPFAEAYASWQTAAPLFLCIRLLFYNYKSI
jgi:hypothetical protein